MQVNGTLINYYIHCKRQCYLMGNRLNLEDNSELVKIGRAIHEERHTNKDNTEIVIDNVKIDKVTMEYVTEVKKSDADIEAAKWQLLYYLKVLKSKGVYRKGRLQCIEKNKKDVKTEIIELTDNVEEILDSYILEVKSLLLQKDVPPVLNKPKCKKCSYYEYCYI